MRSQEKLQEGEISISSSKDDVETEEREYEVYVDIRRGMIKTVIDSDLGFTSKNDYPLFVVENGGSIDRARKNKAKNLLNNRNTQDFIVPVKNEESTESKILKDAGFRVERRETSQIQG